MSTTMLCETQIERHPDDAIGGESRRGSHRLSNALRCEVLHRLGVLKRWRPRVVPDYLLLGTLWHAGAAWALAPEAEQKPSWGYDETALNDYLAELWATDGASYSTSERDAMLAWVEQSIEVWVGWSKCCTPLRTLSVETELAATLGELAESLGVVQRRPELRDEIVTSRHDWFGEDIDGKRYVRDYKGKAPRRFGGRYAMPKLSADYSLNLQVHLNLLLARHSHENVFGFLVEQFSRPTVTQLMSADGPPFGHLFSREVVRVPAFAYVESFYLVERAVAEDVRLASLARQKLPVIQTGRATCACRTPFGSLCEFWDVCSSESRAEAVRRLRADFSRKGH